MSAPTIERGGCSPERNGRGYFGYVSKHVLGLTWEKLDASKGLNDVAQAFALFAGERPEYSKDVDEAIEDLLTLFSRQDSSLRLSEHPQSSKPRKVIGFNFVTLDGLAAWFNFNVAWSSHKSLPDMLYTDPPLVHEQEVRDPFPHGELADLVVRSARIANLGHLAVFRRDIIPSTEPGKIFGHEITVDSNSNDLGSL